jgi:hypothetical protein
VPSCTIHGSGRQVARAPSGTLQSNGSSSRAIATATAAAASFKLVGCSCRHWPRQLQSTPTSSCCSVPSVSSSLSSPLSAARRLKFACWTAALIALGEKNQQNSCVERLDHHQLETSIFCSMFLTCSCLILTSKIASFCLLLLLLLSLVFNRLAGAGGWRGSRR